MDDRKHAAYTSGYWRIEQEANGRSAISAGCKHIATLHDLNCGTGDPRSISAKEVRANSRLIQAAPEMFETLYWLYKAGDCTDLMHGVLFNPQEWQRIVKLLKRVIG